MKLLTGMHYSGTSICAAFLYELGASMGNPESFSFPKEHHPYGRFEQTTFNVINTHLVEGIFWRFAYLQLPSSQRVIHRAKKYFGQIKELDRAYRGRIVKDSRFALTLPAWKSCGADVESVAVSFCHPAEAVKSFMSYYPVSKKVAFRLWYQHYVRILLHTNNVKVWFVKKENLSDESTCRKELKQLCRFFGVKAGSDQIQRAYKKIAPKKTVSSGEDAAAQDEGCPENVLSLWNELCRRHSKQSEAEHSASWS